MIDIMKRAGIFIIMAECMIHCCPKVKYEKYIRFIVGIMLVIMLVMPFFNFINAVSDMSFGEFYQEMKERLSEMENSMEGVSAKEVLNGTAEK